MMQTVKYDRLSAGAKTAIILAHALIGWAWCGALMGVGMELFSVQVAIIVHLIGAPVGFFVLSMFYFGKFAFTSPLQTALIFLGVVVVMDVFVVAMLIQNSFEMFSSPLGTWIPLTLVFIATWFAGLIRYRVQVQQQIGADQEG
jgi:hypothetical protein